VGITKIYVLFHLVVVVVSYSRLCEQNRGKIASAAPPWIFQTPLNLMKFSGQGNFWVQIANLWSEFWSGSVWRWYSCAKYICEKRRQPGIYLGLDRNIPSSPRETIHTWMQPLQTSPWGNFGVGITNTSLRYPSFASQST